MRALACIAVLFYHFSLPQLTSNNLILKIIEISRVYHFGQLGAAYFFSLSSFLLTYLACKEFYATGSFSMSYFFLRRILRIWPLYFLYVLVVVIALGSWSPFSTLPSEWEQLLNIFPYILTFTTNIPLALAVFNGFDYQASLIPTELVVLWSLAVEEQFYLIYPIIMLFMFRFKKSVPFVLITLAVVIGLGFCSRLFYFYSDVIYQNFGGMYYSPFTYLEVFVFGGLAGWIVAKENTHFNKTNFNTIMNLLGGRVWGRIIGLCLFIVLIFVALYSSGYDKEPYRIFNVFQYSILALVFAGLTLWILVNKQSIVSRILSSNIMQTLGVLSYGMYLWHILSLRIVNYFINSTLFVTSINENETLFSYTFFFSYFIVTFLLAAASYQLFEKRFLNLKRPLVSGRCQPMASKSPLTPLFQSGEPDRRI